MSNSQFLAFFSLLLAYIALAPVLYHPLQALPLQRFLPPFVGVSILN